jgi:Transposase
MRSGRAAKEVRPGVPGGAVRIVRETGKPIAQIARDLGIHPGTLGNWVAKVRAEHEGTQGPFDLMSRSRSGCAPRTPNCGSSATFKTIGGLWVNEATK